MMLRFDSDLNLEIAGRRVVTRAVTVRGPSARLPVAAREESGLSVSLPKADSESSSLSSETSSTQAQLS